jgi:hypothetical protein
LCCAAPAGAAQQTTRVFAMQPKLDVAWMQSRATYHDKLFALADGQVAPNLRSDGRNLVTWPEDLGLWAALTGSRGEQARASDSLAGAVVALLSSYAPQMTYYGSKYPAVASRFPPIRQLGLALTDTFGRTAVETFSEMAARYHVWLEAGVNMTQRWHVVCNTYEHPPQEPCDEQNPAKVQALGDPEDPRGYVYEATSPDVSNMALLFGPDGRLVSRQVKTYITPSEVGQDEGVVAALDLVPGSIVDGLSAVPTPVGTLGFVTSKDAWMPDVVDRLEEQGVDLLVQPEFFSGDVIKPQGMWAADTLLASGYSDVLRHPGFAAIVLPSAVGHVFDFAADAQSHIAERLSKPAAGKWLVGQPPAAGLTAVAPWGAPDPIRPGESIADRRKRLGQLGDAAAPAETVIWKDVPVGFPAYKRALGHRRTRFLAARALGRGRRAEQHPAVAMAGSYVVVAYEQRRGAADRLMIAGSRDGGRHWLIGREALPKSPGTQQWPAVTIDGRGRITLAWAKKDSIWFARGSFTARRGIQFGPERSIDPSLVNGPPGWRPSLALGSNGIVHAAWVDSRAHFADGRSQATIRYARIRNGEPERSRRLDAAKPAKLATRMDNAWAPAIAASGKRVLVSWIDFQNDDWDVMSRESRNGGSSFAKQVDSNLEKPDVEDLSDSPQPVFTKRGPLIAWTDFHKRDTFDRVHPLYDTYLAAPGKKPVQVDPYGGRQVSTFAPGTCADGEDAIVAFQDSSTGVASVKITRVRGGNGRGRAFSLSDGPTGAYRPSIACDGGHFVAAWEDMRSGPPRIYAALGALKRIS